MALAHARALVRDPRLGPDEVRHPYGGDRLEQVQGTLFRNTDVRKFNDVYRQILAGNAGQRTALDAWLAERYAKRELVYGLHVTDRAHMTCLVFNYSGRHLHFIDGADGGLFLAAKDFKERAAKLIAV